MNVLGGDGDQQSPETDSSPQARPGSAIKSARPRTGKEAVIVHVDKPKMTFVFFLKGRLKTARPPSARPAAPRLREKNEVVQDELAQPVRPTTGKVANVIVDDGNNAGDDDDADDFLVEEAPKDNLDLDTTESTNIDTTVSVKHREDMIQCIALHKH
jgi:hypothetical protein